MIIRPAAFADIKEIVPFLISANAVTATKDVPVDPDTLRNTLQRVINQPGHQCFLSLEKEKITGVLAAVSNPIWFSKKKQVLDLVFYVEPAHAGHGYYLARRYLGWAKKLKGVAPGEIYLGVLSGMNLDRTQNFYERLGLTLTGYVYRTGGNHVESTEGDREGG